MYAIKKILLFGFVFLFSIVINSQEYFPLTVGNRWDYSIVTQCHGEPEYDYSEKSIEIIGKTKIRNKYYYIFSNQDVLFGKNYLRVENDSLFYLNTIDSTDCLVFAFDQLPDSLYASSQYSSCMFNSIYAFTTNVPMFAFDNEDFKQVHNNFVFSKSYGVTNLARGALCVSEYILEGCIISGTTYGVLLSVPEEVDENIISIKLNQNYPNPFNPSTTISYSISNQDFVTLKILNNLGQEVQTLEKGYKNRGNYSIIFEASNLPSGVYFYKLTTSKFSETKKMLLLR